MADVECAARMLADSEIPELVQEWLGARRWWSSDVLPSGRRIAIVSSRLPRLIDPHGVWLQALRAALRHLNEVCAVALIGDGTAGHELVLRGTERQRTGRILVRCGDWAPRYSREQPSTSTPPGSNTEKAHVELWPACDNKNSQRIPTGVRHTPERDRATIAWADEIIVLALRSHGNLHALLRERLLKPKACVWYADLPGLQSQRARGELIELGAPKWTVRPTPHEIPKFQDRDRAGPLNLSDGADQRIIRCPAAEHWDYLIHTTRACTGPWPDQSHQDYLDSLLDGQPDADHSALRALMRIVAQRRLIASSRAIRGGIRVVSFTAVPLVDLPGLHVFRAHRGRWDFEPYGICIRRDRLKACGVRPVEYASDSHWNQLGAEARPFFQHLRRLDTSADPGGRSVGLDWSVEQEWRHVGDLSLECIRQDEAILFVPTIAEAKKLLELSPWPVTVLGSA